MRAAEEAFPVDGGATTPSNHLAPLNYCGQPGVVLRAGLTTNGLPCAVQLAADRGRESVLLTLAAEFEERFEAFGSWPPFPFRAAL